MKINTFEKCVESYGNDWDRNDSVEREQVLQQFPHSVVVEGAYPELDMATKWNISKSGEKGERWTDLWYGKTDYDYGFSEFFFKDKGDAQDFENAVPTFYAETDTGKWRTEGSDNHIDM